MAIESANAPISRQWYLALADAETATTAPYNPFTAGSDANPSKTIPMPADGRYTGLIVRCKYANGETLTTDPIVKVWGSKTGVVETWMPLRDVDGNAAFTLADNAADCTDGAFNWTTPTPPLDALGCDSFRITVPTAGVASGGATSIEVAFY